MDKKNYIELEKRKVVFLMAKTRNVGIMKLKKALGKTKPEVDVYCRDIKELYEAGLSAEEVASILELPQELIDSIFKLYKRTNSYRTRLKTIEKFPENMKKKEQDDLLRKYYEDGKMQKETSELTGLSIGEVRKAFHRFQKTKSREIRKGSIANFQWKVFMLSVDGYRAESISKMLNIPREKVYKIMRKVRATCDAETLNKILQGRQTRNK